MGATESLLRFSRKGNLEEVEKALGEGAKVNRGDFDDVTSLAWAARGDHIAIVERLLVAGADTSLVDKTGTSPLLYAVLLGHARTVERLVNAGAAVDTAAANGTTPLGAAAQRGHTFISEKLLNAGANVNLVGLDGWSPLLFAARGGHVTVVESLLAARASVDFASESGDTALLIAAGAGYDEVTEKLLKAGASVDLTNIDGFTPLRLAISRNHPAVVAALLDAGANANFVNSNGLGPLQVAAEYGNLAIIESLLAAGAQVNSFGNNTSSPLYVASMHGHTAVVERLLAIGAQVNIRRGGNTPLIGAASNGHAAVIEMLVDAGALLDTSNSIGSALTHAAMCGHAHAARVLLEAGADFQTRHSNGLTASKIFQTNGNVEAASMFNGYELPVATYFLAVERGSIDVVRRLAQVRASARGELNRTPLHVAALVGKLDAVKVLVEGGAALSARDDSGHTPLHLASCNGHVQCVTFMLDRGASATVVSDLGYLPIDAAAVAGHLEAVRVLADRGSNLQNLTSDGRTILHHAVWGRSTALLEYLLAQGVVSVNKTTKEEEAPLHHAVHALANIAAASPPTSEAEVADQVVILRLLLAANGVNINAQDNTGRTPLFVGSQRGDVRSVRVLLDAGARTDIPDNSGKTPLAVAESPDIRAVVDLFHNSQQFHERCFSFLNIDDAVPVDATQLLALVPLITSVHDLRLMLTVCTLHADAAREGNTLKAAFDHVVASKLTFDDEACVYFKLILEHCERRQLISRGDFLLLDRRAEKANTESAAWVIELKRHVHTNSWRLDTHERHMAAIIDNINRVHSLVMENRANINQVASHLANLQNAYVTHLEQEEKARRIRLVCSVLASVSGFGFGGTLEHVAGNVFDLANPGDIAAMILKNKDLLEFLKDTTQEHIKDALQVKLEALLIPQDKFEDLVRIGLVLTHPELIHEDTRLETHSRQETDDVEPQMQGLQIEPQPYDMHPILEDPPRSESNTASSGPDGEAQLCDPAAFPYHDAVQKSLGDVAVFQELTKHVCGDVDGDATAQMRLVEMTTTSEELCAAQYAYLLGYTDVGDAITARMSNPPAFSQVSASSVELQGDIDDYPFVFAVAESGGDVEACEDCMDALDADDHALEDSIPALVVCESCREVAWTVVELACHSGYVDLVKVLFKDVCRSVPPKARVLSMKHARERAKVLSERSILSPAPTAA